MKITDVTTHLLSSNWAAVDKQWEDTGGGYKSSALVRIETDAGITGLGRGHHRLLRARSRADARRLLPPAPHRQGPAPDERALEPDVRVVEVVGPLRRGRVGDLRASTLRSGTSRARPWACRFTRCSAGSCTERMPAYASIGGIPRLPRRGGRRGPALGRRGLSGRQAGPVRQRPVRLRRDRGRLHPSPVDGRIRARTRRAFVRSCAKRSGPRSTSSSTTTWARRPGRCR